MNALRNAPLILGGHSFIRQLGSDPHATEGEQAEIVAACLDQGMVTASAVTFIWTAVTYRMAWRYGQRGYRYLHLDAGHVGQNLYLTAEALGLGAVAVAAFDDEAMNAACGLDGAERFVIYLAPVGRPVKSGD